MNKQRFLWNMQFAFLEVFPNIWLYCICILFIHSYTNCFDYLTYNRQSNRLYLFSSLFLELLFLILIFCFSSLVSLKHSMTLRNHIEKFIFVLCMRCKKRKCLFDYFSYRKKLSMLLMLNTKESLYAWHIYFGCMC